MKTKPTTDPWIPRVWTFNSAKVAERFEEHVRSQLPWYDALLKTIAHLGACYVPRRGRILDVGAGTGNVALALNETIRERQAEIVNIEPSREMGLRFAQRVKLGALSRFFGQTVEDWLDTSEDEPSFDLIVCNLVLMFLPYDVRADVLQQLFARLNKGGALVVVERCVAPGGYLGSVFARLAMRWKVEATPALTAEEILAKELSLIGVQRAFDPKCFERLGWGGRTEPFFRFGDFAGFIVTKEDV